jgi:hypothetical protein
MAGYGMSEASEEEHQLGRQLLSVLGVPPPVSSARVTAEVRGRNEEWAQALGAPGAPSHAANTPRTREAGVVVKTGSV